MSRKPDNERDERRLVDVTGVEVFGAGQVIELVAKNPVTIGNEQMKEQVRSGEEKHDDRSPPGDIHRLGLPKAAANVNDPVEGPVDFSSIFRNKSDEPLPRRAPSPSRRFRTANRTFTHPPWGARRRAPGTG